MALMLMPFRDVLSASVIGITGYLARPDDVVALARMIEHNLPVLSMFRNVIVATNFGGDEPSTLAVAHTRLWRRYFPAAVFLDSPINRGHSIGASDLDNLLFNYCRSHDIPWLCKAANDIALDPQVCDINVTPADFYYLNAVSYGALADAQFDLQHVAATLFFPQTTFFVINVAATDYLMDIDLLNRSWAIVNRIPQYDGRIWNHIPGWSCERLLRLCVERNRLSRCHLMTDSQLRELLHMVQTHQIDDCSHKGISINGICHAQGLADLRDAYVITGAPDQIVGGSGS